MFQWGLVRRIVLKIVVIIPVIFVLWMMLRSASRLYALPSIEDGDRLSFWAAMLGAAFGSASAVAGAIYVESWRRNSSSRHLVSFIEEQLEGEEDHIAADRQALAAIEGNARCQSLVREKVEEIKERTQRRLDMYNVIERKFEPADKDQVTILLQVTRIARELRDQDATLGQALARLEGSDATHATTS